MHEQEGGTEGAGDADSPLNREPSAGLDPRTPGSRPEPKVDAQPLSHPGFRLLPKAFSKLTA